MPSGIRLHRIQDRVRQELSQMLIRETNDPRLKNIFINDVKIDKELAFAHIFVSAVEGASYRRWLCALTFFVQLEVCSFSNDQVNILSCRRSAGLRADTLVEDHDLLPDLAGQT